MHARLRSTESWFTNSLPNYNKPDFPSLADEIAEPRPDMNIKVAAFTVSEKSINRRHGHVHGNHLLQKREYAMKVIHVFKVTQKSEAVQQPQNLI